MENLRGNERRIAINGCMQGMNRVSGMMSTVQKMEKWLKWAVAAVFIGVGIYYIIIVYGPLVGVV